MSGPSKHKGMVEGDIQCLKKIKVLLGAEKTNPHNSSKEGKCAGRIRQPKCLKH